MCLNVTFLHQWCPAIIVCFSSGWLKKGMPEDSRFESADSQQRLPGNQCPSHAHAWLLRAGIQIFLFCTICFFPSSISKKKYIYISIAFSMQGQWCYIPIWDSTTFENSNQNFSCNWVISTSNDFCINPDYWPT